MTEGKLCERSGLIYTFYSFKGGVGRSMAVANVATLLAKWGKRVLVMDWDLEAPGLENFFRRWLSSSRKQTPGLIELIQSSAGTMPLDWRSCVLKADIPQAESISLISAGKEDADYFTRLRQINWERLFEEKALGRYLERLRQEWAKEFDFVLIDSRTGLTDIGGICTIHLPDVVIALFTTTEQSFLGVKDIMQRARDGHSKLPVDRRRLLVIPVPARDESNSEYRLAEKWRRDFAPHLKEFYEDWMPKEETVERVMDYLKIPYIAFWSFGEKLPVLEEDTDNPKKLAFSYQLIARLMLGRLDWEEVKKGSQSAEAEISYKRAVERETSEAQRLAEILQEHQREREETRQRDRLAVYLKERWSPAKGEHWGRSTRRYLYWTLSAVFLIAAIGSAVSVVDGKQNDLWGLFIMLSLSILCFVLGLRGLNSRRVVQSLEKERWRFEGKAGDYAGLEPEESFSRFVAKVDLILSHSTWFGLLGKTSQGFHRIPEGESTEAVRDAAVTISTERAASLTEGEVFPPIQEESDSYDVFVSYREGYLSTNWAREFIPLFTAWLSEFLGREPKLISGPSILTNGSDEGGEQRTERVRRALDASRCMVAIVTPAYFQSEWCLKEWRGAFEKWPARILPVVLQRGEFPPRSKSD